VIATVETKQKAEKSEQQKCEQNVSCLSKPTQDATDDREGEVFRPRDADSASPQPNNISSSFGGSFNMSSTSVSSMSGEVDGGVDLMTVGKMSSIASSSLQEIPALNSDETEPRPSESSTTGASTATSRPGGTFRKILPSTSRPPVSHLRTPGVVTVQVCSSIPANLTLSSITNPVTVDEESVVTTPSFSDGCSTSVTGSSAGGRVSGFPGIVKTRGVLAGGGNVMVTPLSPTIGPTGKTVAQIMIKSTGFKEVGKEGEGGAVSNF
jgi:hypothetical protein